MSLKKVIACIKSHKYFLITTHTNPEADALGSEIAFYRLLKSMDKYATIVNEEAAPYEYDFLPGINNIKKLSGKNNPKALKFDCCIIVDCSDFKRTGEVFKIKMNNKPIINIDHHISNKKFGDINWIEPAASSCTQMIYKLYKKLHILLDREIALLLYVGIVSDTGSFHYSNTNSLTHRVASELLKYNLDILQIYKNLYENIPFEDMKLLSIVVSSMRLKAQGRIVWFKIPRHLLKGKKVSFDLTENILSFGRAIKDVQVAVLFKENLGAKDEVRVNLRSQNAEVDVNRIAHFFGGGGHKAASGCTIKGKIDQVRREVLAKIKEALD